MTQEYRKYRMNPESNEKYWMNNNDSREFECVFHVSHIKSSLRILEDKKINKNIVFDKSKLNETRILVSWLSPNDWSNSGGFRYGSIRFQFKFNDIIKDLNCYWIEDIAYNTTACRFLLTRNHYSYYQAYDPVKDPGPWKYNEYNKKHYFNNKYCIEFMFEDDLDLNLVNKIDTVRHNPGMCNINRNCPGDCEDLKYQIDEIESIFIANIIANHYVMNDSYEKFYLKNIIDQYVIKKFYKRLKLIITEDNRGIINPIGNIDSQSEISKLYIKYFLFSYSKKNYNEMEEIIRNFKSKIDILKSIKNCINDLFDIIIEE